LLGNPDCVLYTSILSGAAVLFCRVVEGGAHKDIYETALNRFTLLKKLPRKLSVVDYLIREICVNRGKSFLSSLPPIASPKTPSVPAPPPSKSRSYLRH